MLAFQREIRAARAWPRQLSVLRLFDGFGPSCRGIEAQACELAPRAVAAVGSLQDAGGVAFALVGGRGCGCGLMVVFRVYLLLFLDLGLGDGGGGG